MHNKNFAYKIIEIYIFYRTSQHQQKHKTSEQKNFSKYNKKEKKKHFNTCTHHIRIVIRNKSIFIQFFACEQNHRYLFPN